MLVDCLQTIVISWFSKSYNYTPTIVEDRRLLSAVFCYACVHAGSQDNE